MVFLKFRNDCAGSLSLELTCGFRDLAMLCIPNSLRLATKSIIMLPDVVRLRPLTWCGRFSFSCVSWRVGIL